MDFLVPISLSAWAAGFGHMHNDLLGTDLPYGALLAAGPGGVTITSDLPAHRGFRNIARCPPSA